MFDPILCCSIPNQWTKSNRTLVSMGKVLVGSPVCPCFLHITNSSRAESCPSRRHHAPWHVRRCCNPTRDTHISVSSCKGCPVRYTCTNTNCAAFRYAQPVWNTMWSGCSLRFETLHVTLCSTRFNIKIFHILLKVYLYVYVLRNSAQTALTERFCDPYKQCLLRSTNWVFK